MAILTDPDRQGLWADFMRDLGVRQERIGVMSKADLRAAVDAIDTWIDDNAASFNSAIPQPARAALTGRQKALLLLAIVKRRFEVT